jgi:hypothetical protein
MQPTVQQRESVSEKLQAIANLGFKKIHAYVDKEVCS